MTEESNREQYYKALKKILQKVNKNQISRASTH